MTKFKGTKGIWKLANNDYGYYTSVRNIDDTRKVCVSRVNNMLESNANMLLISKAPEMFEMLKDIKDYLGSDKRQEVEQLIKEATEL